jgi:hypothetical protein
MKKIIAAIVGFGVLGAAGCWVSGHHVVRVEDGVLVLEKRVRTWGDSYADVRGWRPADYDARPELKRTLIEQGHRDLLWEARRREAKAALDDIAGRASAVAGEVAARVSGTAEIVAGKAAETAATVSEKIAEAIETSPPPPETGAE